MCLRNGIFLLLCVAFVLSAGFASSAHTTYAKHEQAQQLLASRGDTVGIVYYRCELSSLGLCAPRGGLYYVHNGIALRDLHLNDPFSRIGHVGNWTRGQETLDICGETLAAQVVRLGSPHEPCHGNVGSGGTWRPWARVRTIDYRSFGPPIAYMVNEDTSHPHNGAFQEFAFVNSSGTVIASTRTTSLSTAISMTNAQPSREGLLMRCHVVNPSGTPSGREAYNRNFFDVRCSSVRGRIRIERLHT